MPFVKRDAEGRIVGVYREAAEDGLDAVDAGDPELESFLARVVPAGTAAAGWVESDLSMARVVEDLIDALIDRGIIGFEDLPKGARAKIIGRRCRRDDLAYVGTLWTDDVDDMAGEDAEPDAGYL